MLHNYYDAIRNHIKSGLALDFKTHLFLNSK